MINSIWIKSFRSLDELSLSFDRGSMISIVSKNNVGKTSVLEACYILGYLNSFIASDLSQVVPFDTNASYMGIKIANQKMNYNYYLKVGSEGEKYINLNERMVKSRSEIQSLFRTMYISSDSLLLITSRPSYRRHQLDQSISLYSSIYRKNLATYRRLLIQKNRLLKDNGPEHIIKQMNQQLAPCIYEILKERINYLNNIENRVHLYFDTLNIADGKFNINYITQGLERMDGDEILNYLNQNLAKEKMVRYSVVGPHRDDFNFTINGRNIKQFYSRGICRVLAYFFYLSQACFIEKETNLPMLLLLDEPFSEIFSDLKNQLIHNIPKSFFVIYTSTQFDEITNFNREQLYGIKNGSLCKI